MALQGVSYELTDEIRQFAIKYVEESGFYKYRLADFLGISRPTFNKVLEENPDFFTALKRADAIFCKNLIDIVRNKNPVFLLKHRYKDEFSDSPTSYKPEEEIKKILNLIDEEFNKREGVQ